MTGQQPFETVVATHGATVLRVCRAVLAGTDAKRTLLTLERQ
jgi:hypothetical protein